MIYGISNQLNDLEKYIGLSFLSSSSSLNIVWYSLKKTNTTFLGSIKTIEILFCSNQLKILVVTWFMVFKFSFELERITLIMSRFFSWSFWGLCPSWQGKFFVGKGYTYNIFVERQYFTSWITCFGVWSI